MKQRENSDFIPIDLILEILSKLPAKSIRRFRCVSKLWGSMLGKPYFTELFLKSSSARPRLLIGVIKDNEWFFFSTPQPYNIYEKSSLVVSADFHTKFSGELYFGGCGYGSGFIYFPGMHISRNDKDAGRVICNPITGHYGILPELKLTYRNWIGHLGFDPIGKQLKILSMNNIVGNEKVHHILTFGTKEVGWRKIQGPLTHDVRRGEICINGVIYYLAYNYDELSYLIGCFDVRSEEFKVLNLIPHSDYAWSTKLINYKGKLAMMNITYDKDGGFPIKLRISVLEDVKKREWSKYIYTLRAENEVVKVNNNLFVVGMTAMGDIVLAKEKTYKPFYVFYFNPERNTLLSVEIQGVGEDHDWFNTHRVCAFVDHVEDLQFNIMKTTYITTSISTSTLCKKDNHVSTSTSSKKRSSSEQINIIKKRSSSEHINIIYKRSLRKDCWSPQQDRHTFENANKFNSLYVF